MLRHQRHTAKECGKAPLAVSWLDAVQIQRLHGFTLALQFLFCIYARPAAFLYRSPLAGAHAARH